MQLKSIRQCKVSMTVYHPLWGKGVIDEVTKINITVKFDKTDWFRSFTDDEFSKKTNLGADSIISHLYDSEIYICEKIEETVTHFRSSPLKKITYQPVKNSYIL